MKLTVSIASQKPYVTVTRWNIATLIQPDISFGFDDCLTLAISGVYSKKSIKFVHY